MAHNRLLKLSTLALISGTAANANMESICAGLDGFGVGAGLDRPHRLAQYIPQLAHESVRFRYDREIWDGKGAQARYDTRTDLGNTPERDGDGFKYRGRGPIQITGKHNTREFRNWCRQRFNSVPDFVVDPDQINTDPWEGLGPIWYWSSRNLNRYADTGNIEMITRRINGGLNGYADRLRMFDRTALVLLGYDPRAIRKFQDEAGIVVDGESGPQTRGAMHGALSELPKWAPEVVDAAAEEAPQSDDVAVEIAQQSPAEILDAIRKLVA